MVGVHELAAKVFGAELVEEDHRDVLVDVEPVAFEGGQVVRVHGPRPRLDRRLVGARGCGKLAGCHPLRARFAQPGEEAQLEAEVDEPGAVETAEARDEVVESVVEGHRRPIVACGNAVAGAGRVP